MIAEAEIDYENLEHEIPEYEEIVKLLNAQKEKLNSEPVVGGIHDEMKGGALAEVDWEEL